MPPGREILIARGKPEMIRGDWQPGATVIDVGINRIEREARPLVGDVPMTRAASRSPALDHSVPGGAGPMTMPCCCRTR
jgi:methylenetetrahydrofolate dehydrogenase (NADP+)/methenyltetrahydrofolate cyclohydrolase